MGAGAGKDWVDRTGDGALNAAVKQEMPAAGVAADYAETSRKLLQEHRLGPGEEFVNRIFNLGGITRSSRGRGRGSSRGRGRGSGRTQAAAAASAQRRARKSWYRELSVDVAKLAASMLPAVPANERWRLMP